MTQRTDRIDELLREEMTSIFSRDVDDARIGFATITNVETAPDLRHAKVLISVIGQPAERKSTLAAMGHAMPFVRHELGKRLRLKRIPEFHLELDDSVERGTRILHLLDELEAGRAPAGETTDEETLPTPRPIVGGDDDQGLGAAAAEVAARENARRRSRRAAPPRSTTVRRRR
jgi:ribosome-binding factor A